MAGSAPPTPSSERRDTLSQPASIIQKKMQSRTGISQAVREQSHSGAPDESVFEATMQCGSGAESFSAGTIEWDAAPGRARCCRTSVAQNRPIGGPGSWTLSSRSASSANAFGGRYHAAPEALRGSERHHHRLGEIAEAVA